MKSFIDLFLDYTKEAESPTSFFRWAAYACVAAAMRDNVWRDQGIKVIYPNNYTLLVSPSAEHRKSVPLDLTYDLLFELNNTKLVRGRSSIQSILVDELAQQETGYKTGKPIKGGSCLLCADELASFFVEDPSCSKILCDIYEFKRLFTYALRGTGKVRINNICVTMLAASNEEFLKDIYNKQALFGGLLGRTFFVKPDEFRKANALMRIDKTKYNKTDLLTALQSIAIIKGEMVFEEDAIVEYEKWYNNLRESYRNKPDKTGLLGRIHTGVIKIAMILGISSEYALITKKKHVEEAIYQCMSLIPNYDDYTLLASRSSMAETGFILLEELWKAEKHEVSHKEFLARNWSLINLELLDKLVDTLQEAGLIKIDISLDAAKTYKMTEKCIKMYEEKKESI